jgi:hypothetical protein
VGQFLAVPIATALRSLVHSNNPARGRTESFGFCRKIPVEVAQAYSRIKNSVSEAAMLKVFSLLSGLVLAGGVAALAITNPTLEEHASNPQNPELC